MNNKRNTIITTFAIALLLIVLIGATYAYFTSQGGSITSDSVSVTSNTTDNLSFQISNDISFRVSQVDLAENGNNKSGESTVTAILTPNNKTNQGTMNYYMYLKMDSNPTVYSSTNTGHNPELMLQVFDENDSLVTLTGLGSQVTIKGLTGYDITGKEVLITLLDNHAIVASGSSKTETWTVKITMINLDVDQVDNTNKEISGEIIIRKTLTTYCELEPTSPGCSLSLNYNPTLNVITLDNGYIYHHDATLTNGANDGSFRYAGANPNNYICFGSDEETCPDANLYRIIGLIPVDVVTNDQTSPVTTEKRTLYKIIKHDYLTSTEVLGYESYDSSYHPSTYNGPSGNQYVSNPQGYRWTSFSFSIKNYWDTSPFNYNGLNSEYINYIGNIWSEKIATVMWKVGGGDWSYIGSATPMSTVYTNEITESGQHATNAPTDGKNELPAKVGLMYVSDYGYSAPSTTWSTALGAYNKVVANNWLYRGVNEWTISRNSNNTNSMYAIFYNGYVSSGDITAIQHVFGVRLTFYLTEDTVIDMTNHNGTKTDPYRIS